MTGLPKYPVGYTPLDMLRFVERTVQVPTENFGGPVVGKKVRILQQFIPASGVSWPVRIDGEGQVTRALGVWIDVPLLEET